MLVALLLIGPALLLEQLGQPGSGWEPARDPARTYAERAIRTQRFAEQQLGFLAGADRCGASAYLAFERLPASPLSDAWYNASQLMADAALIRLGQPALSAGEVTVCCPA